MTRIFQILIGFWFGSLVCGIHAEEPKKELMQLLDEVRAHHQVPAMAGAVIKDGKILAFSAVGKRRFGKEESVVEDDKFHIGSITKSMTATLAAIAVDEGLLQWATPIEELFPEWKDLIHPDYRKVTLEEILSHRGGFPGQPPGDLWAKILISNEPLREQRTAFAKALLSRKPAATPRTEYVYSNQGYMIAGVILERKWNKPWEQIVQEKLLTPLKLKHAGFGAPAKGHEKTQPWGHAKTSGGFSPMAPGAFGDNPPALGPSGTIHCSIEDLAQYALFHLEGSRGKGSMLKPATFEKLYLPAEGFDYAMGWSILDRDWAGGKVMNHDGSNTMFYAAIWIAPNKNFAMVIATNCNSFEACDELAGKLRNKFLDN